MARRKTRQKWILRPSRKWWLKQRLQQQGNRKTTAALFPSNGEKDPGACLKGITWMLCWKKVAAARMIIAALMAEPMIIENNRIEKVRIQFPPDYLFVFPGSIAGSGWSPNEERGYCGMTTGTKDAHHDMIAPSGMEA